MSAVTPAPSKVRVAARAFVKAITSKAAIQLELALARYVAYAVLAALGIDHAHALGF